MTRLRIVFAIVLVASALGCNKRGNSGASYSFSRPELLEFVCFGRDASAKYYVLPRRCCAGIDPSRGGVAPAGGCTAKDTQGNTTAPLTPALHALLSQSTRGEIASIDLARREVLDLTRLVPGETFRDSGGLPVAIVTPRRQPRMSEELGPEWTYVASAENLEVRAIPNSCLREGEQGISVVGAPLSCRTLWPRVALRGVPGDMILGPDEALWVTLPDLGYIARIELGSTPSAAFADAEIRYYGVSPAPSAVAPEPMLEAPEYVTTCGLGVPFVPSSTLLPNAPRARASSAVRPTRLRYDAESGLLLVADGLAPVLHAYAFGADGTLIAFPALPTGMPVREFALTAPVPAVPSADPLVPLVPAMPPDPPQPDAPWKRYLYAIEEGGEGLVMAFEFAAGTGGGEPRLTPLAIAASHERYRDRLRVRSPAATLTVIDTRDLAPSDADPSGSSYVCGDEGAGTTRLTAKYVDDLRARRDMRRKETPSADPNAERARLAELSQLEARLSIVQDAGPRQLRGVFLMVAVADGQLAILDVYDLDVACRAAESCNEAALDQPIDDDQQNAVAIRRHAPRLASAGKVTVSTLGSQASALAPITCEPGERPALTQLIDMRMQSAACVPIDPWSQINDLWSVENEGLLVSYSGNALEFPGLPIGETSRVPSPMAGEITLHAPRGVNLCTAGVQEGDVVAFIEAPAERARDCETPTPTTAKIRTVVGAFDDGLVLGPIPEDPARAALFATSEELRRCYPDGARVELRAQGFAVRLTGSNAVNGQRHRVIAGADGRCVLDESRDARLTLRTNPASGDPSAVLSYRSPNLAFAFRAPEAGKKTASDFDLQIRNAPTALSANNAQSRNFDALPVGLYYLPEDQSLFAVDTASQGLRRYTLKPFEWDDDSIYR